MKEGKHVIWSNYDLDYEDWRDDLEAEYPEQIGRASCRERV